MLPRPAQLSVPEATKRTESWAGPGYDHPDDATVKAGASEPVPQVPRPRDQCWKQNL